VIPLINCQQVCKAFGSKELFESLSVTLFPGDHVGLIGPNGAGKSTFLKILSGIEEPDDGSVVMTGGLRVGYVPQNIQDVEGTVEEVVVAAAGGIAAEDEYDRYARVRRVLGTLGFSDLSQEAKTLSGGWQRRLSIAQALVGEPDVLLLDEPTNHLDLESILWLESFLQREKIAFVVTSHDRVFLDNVSNKVWEISHSYPGGVFTVEGAYAEFMERRKGFLEAQMQREKGLKSKLRREEEWLKATPQARTTKSRSRIEEAARLQQELARVKRRNVEKKSDFSIAHTGKQTKKLLVAKNISKTLGDKKLFESLDIILSRGDRLGIVGENGSGKSTLLKVLGGEIDSESGTIKLADDLKICYFDQLRDKLDLKQPLRRGLSPNGDMIRYRGMNVHVNSWCERFLFSKDQLDLPMKQLSGGERARVLIARLMAKPADILLLDEPTNDLDIDTLEVLEESLDDFPGVVVLVSHDRAMMNRVADILITVGDDNRRFNDVEGWLDWRKELRKKPKTEKTAFKKPKEKRGLSWKEQQELAGIEQKIANTESEIEKLEKKTEKPLEAGQLQKVCDQLASAQETLDTLFTRWQQLEDKK